MNARTLLIASTILNLVLLAAVAAYTRPKPAPAAAPPPQTASVPTARKPVARTEAMPPPAATGPAFHWRQVESEDYKRYIANLRAIGCPEETCAGSTGPQQQGRPPCLCGECASDAALLGTL